MNRDFKNAILNQEPVDTAHVLSEYIEQLTFEQIPSDVIDTVRMYIADYYAACFAGIKINKTFNDAVLSVIALSGPQSDASVFEYKNKLSAENAAYMNAIYAHGADMDDGNRKAMGHVAAHVMSAVFALAESSGNCTWKDVITAIISGYEVYNRVAAMAQPGLVHRGFHSTGTAGTIACGAACAKLLGLDHHGIYNAIGIAAIQASGLIIIAESGQANKPLNPANAARNGILSARLAQKGLEGPELPLESKKGWFHAMTDEIHYEMLLDLGEVFTISESYLKPYPSCRHTHCGIEAAIAIRQQILKNGKDISDIESLKLYIYNNAIQIAGQIHVPKNQDEAKFSIHYSLATAMMTGNYTLDDLSRDIDADLQLMIKRLELIADASMEDRASGVRGSRLVVRMKDGISYEKTVLLPKGDAANPFSWSDMKLKMEACMSGFDYNIDRMIQRMKTFDLNEEYKGIYSLYQ